MFNPLFWYGASVLLWGSCWGFLCFVLCLPRVQQAPRRLGAAALICAWHAGALVFLPWFYWAEMLGFEPPPTWVSPLYHPVDWTGQVVSLLVSGMVVYGLQWVTPAEVGLNGLQPRSWRVVGPVIAAVAVAVVLNAYFTRQGLSTLWWNERLYHSTLPALAEEVFYRGVLLGLLNQVFARRLPLLGTQTSWGGVVGVVLFALAHDLKFPSALAQTGNFHALWGGGHYWLSLWHGSLSSQVCYLAMGTLFLWVRERTGSCWAAVGAHCLINTSLTIGASVG